jgi:hypothetical protein
MFKKNPTKKQTNERVKALNHQLKYPSKEQIEELIQALDIKLKYPSKHWVVNKINVLALTNPPKRPKNALRC